MDPSGIDLTVQLSRLRRGRSILFERGDVCLSDLLRELSACDRRTVALWGVTNAERVAGILGSGYLDDPRPAEAVRLGRMWMSGRAGMAEARAAILAVHAMSSDVHDRAEAALCHAVGQGCSCVHTPGHGTGLPVYELTAIVLREGPGCGMEVSSAIGSYRASLGRCREDSVLIGDWARFLRCFRERFPVRPPVYHNNIYPEIGILQ